MTLDIDCASVVLPIKHDWHKNDGDGDGEEVASHFPSLARMEVIFRSCPRNIQKATLIAGMKFVKACDEAGLLHTTIMYVD